MSSETLFFQTPSLTIHRAAGPRIASRVFLGLYVFSGIFGVIGAFGKDVLTIFIPWLLSLAGWAILFGSYVASLTPVWGAATVEVTDLDVTFLPARGASRRVRRADVTGALVVSRRMGEGSIATVEIETAAGDRFTVAFTDPDDARRLVERLGFGPGGARVRSRLARPSRRLVHPVLGGIAWLTGLFFAAAVQSWASRTQPWEEVAYMGLWPLVTTGVYLLLRRLARPPEVVVGEDAVVIEGSIRRKLIPRQEAEASGAVPLGGLLVDDERAEAVRRLVLERSAPVNASDDALATFAREGSTLSEWRDRLRAKMEQGGYRSTATTVDVAAAVLRSSRATADERIGAAVALRIAGEPPERIRIAADAVADDRLREALEAVAEDADDARVAKALRAAK